MAGYTREMQTAIGVAFVYTPPYFRGKGYATSCVAQIIKWHWREDIPGVYYTQIC